MKLFSFLCIIIGAVMIFIFDDNSEYDKYLKIIGFILLMFGLYRSTRLWVKENPKKDKNEETKSLDDQLKDF
ncbi:MULTISPECIES: hypothetical protein [Galbibacter]|uniref:Uncharacterized protein n=1 Tax=Galbibacter pacificus TaxID=2996052 RepID=A0ABT6FVL1_9FLAO|nr:hypothetical protein [Galbibacter pacificus]MDG3583402.1 hypothetical protein [Galbibacter pacificus]MDG3587121.1 hypothetical protein [Galbibacter pacificus]